MTGEELIAFESEVVEEFNKGNIRAPIHLYNSNEAQMIEIIRDTQG
jgi:hypothetical protein